MAREPLGIARAHSGSSGFRGFSILGLLRFRRAIGGIRRLQRLGFQGFLRGVLLAAIVCTGAAMSRKNADKHDDGKHSSRNRKQTPARKPAIIADHRATAPDERAIMRNAGSAHVALRLATGANRTRNRYARMARRRRDLPRMTTLLGHLLVNMSVDRFSHHHVLPRFAHTQKRTVYIRFRTW